MRHFGTHRSKDVKYYLENVYANPSARLQPLKTPDIEIIRPFDVFGICIAESETISQLAGNRLRKGSTADFHYPVPFFCDISFLLYKSKQEFIGWCSSSTSHLCHSTMPLAHATKPKTRLLPLETRRLTSNSCSSSCSFSCSSGLLVSILTMARYGDKLRKPVPRSYRISGL